jgi:hypothetical protein
MLHGDWDLYDTRHTVFRPARMSPAQLEEGYWRAYRDFYRWPAIIEGAMSKASWAGRLRHFAYAAGWKKFEPLWDFALRAKRVAQARPLLEAVLSRRPPREPNQESRRCQPPEIYLEAGSRESDRAVRSTSDMSLRVFSP